MTPQKAIIEFVAQAEAYQRLSRHTVAALTSDLSVFSQSPCLPSEIESLDAGIFGEHVTYLQGVCGLKLASIRRHVAALRNLLCRRRKLRSCMYYVTPTHLLAHMGIQAKSVMMLDRTISA
jgi:site-specific recombinase XerD